MIEIVSPGNKGSRHAIRALVDKACELLEHRIHLLIIDPFPPGPRDPNGVHAAIRQEVANAPFVLPADRRLTLVSYECDLKTRAYIEPVAVGDALPDMPLFLAPSRASFTATSSRPTSCWTKWDSPRSRTSAWPRI